MTPFQLNLKNNLIHLDFSSEELDLYDKFHEVLKEWNAKFNLISRKSFDVAHASHFADSILISDIAKAHRKGRKVKDFGSGAGFPGLVFAIRNPGVEIELVERSTKKLSFLGEVKTLLNLSWVSLKPEIKKIPQPVLVMARAVMPPPELLSFMFEMVSIGSVIVVNVGGEGAVLPVNGFHCIDDKTYELPAGFGSRKCVLFEKVSRGTL